jgi:hypothetical protein
MGLAIAMRSMARIASGEMPGARVTFSRNERGAGRTVRFAVPGVAGLRIPDMIPNIAANRPATWHKFGTPYQLRGAR